MLVSLLGIAEPASVEAAGDADRERVIRRDFRLTALSGFILSGLKMTEGGTARALQLYIVSGRQTTVTRIAEGGLVEG